MTAKVCPRCGSQYENFKSTTCPQCFAILVAVDEETADELAAARAEVEGSDEFKETKLADDERFRQQSFGACLGIAALTLLTLVVAVVLLVSAAHRKSAHPQTVVGPKVAVVREDPLTTLPVAAAGLEEVLPAQMGPFNRQSADANTVLTGTLTPLFHGVYSTQVSQSPNNGGNGKESQGHDLTPSLLGAGGRSLDVYALPAGRPTTEQNEFRMGVTLASQIGGANRPTLFFATEYWHFAVLAAPRDLDASGQFRDALATHFGYTGVGTSKDIHL